MMTSSTSMPYQASVAHSAKTTLHPRFGRGFKVDGDAFDISGLLEEYKHQEGLPKDKKDNYRLRSAIAGILKEVCNFDKFPARVDVIELAKFLI